MQITFTGQLDSPDSTERASITVATPVRNAAGGEDFVITSNAELVPGVTQVMNIKSGDVVDVSVYLIPA